MRLIDADELIAKVTRFRDLAKKRVEDTPVNSPCYRTYVAQANERHGFIGMIKDAPTKVCGKAYTISDYMKSTGTRYEPEESLGGKEQ